MQTINIMKILFPKTFAYKYKHLGYSYTGSIPGPWEEPVQEFLKYIERKSWPKYLPRFICRAIHYLAYQRGGSYWIRYNYWYNLRTEITKHIIIYDIKEKFGGIRIYGIFSDEINNELDKLENKLDHICSNCGMESEYVKITSINGWYQTACPICKHMNKSYVSC